MAINYNIHTDLELDDLRQRLDAHARNVGGLWELWKAGDALGPFHEEIMEEYGIGKGFKTCVWTRHSKHQSVAALAKLMDFYSSLPERKLIRKDDTVVDFRED